MYLWIYFDKTQRFWEFSSEASIDNVSKSSSNINILNISIPFSCPKTFIKWYIQMQISMCLAFLIDKLSISWIMTSFKVHLYISKCHKWNGIWIEWRWWWYDANSSTFKNIFICKSFFSIYYIFIPIICNIFFLGWWPNLNWRCDRLRRWCNPRNTSGRGLRYR